MLDLTLAHVNGLLEEHINELLRARAEFIDQCALEALLFGWDLHVHEAYGRIHYGVEYLERPGGEPIIWPQIVYHAPVSPRMFPDSLDFVPYVG